MTTYKSDASYWQAPKNALPAKSKLIAAAPDLLAALEYLVAGGYLKDNTLALKIINKAINKARGA